MAEDPINQNTVALQADLEYLRDNITPENVVNTIKLLCDAFILLNGYNGETQKSIRDVWELINKRGTL